MVVANGADGVGGGIYNAGGATLTLTDTVVSTNRTGSRLGADGSIAGGGIYNEGTMTLTRTVVSSNQTGEGNDGPGGYGGGIANIGTATLIDSTVADNATGGGGYGGAGGGLFNYGTLTLIRCTVSGNTAGGGDAYGNGGGIANGDGVPALSSPATGGTLILVDSTVSGNRAADGGEIGGSGGGIFNGGTAEIASCTIADNLAGGGYLESGNGGGIATGALGTTIARDTLIVGNGSAALLYPGVYDTAFRGPDCFGSLTSQGYNFLQEASDCTIAGDPTGDINGRAPHLGPLQDNGGPTQTRALLAGSPAIDAGNPNGCTDLDGSPLAIDQRGAPRLAAGDRRCDIGAYEATLPAYPTVTRTPTSTPTITPTPSVTATRTLRPLPTPKQCGPGTACLLIGTAVGAPGARVTVAVTLLPNERSIAGTQNDIGFSSTAAIAALSDGTPDCAVNPGLDKNGTAFAFLPNGCTPGIDCVAVRAIVLSLKESDAILSAAVLYTCAVDIAASAAPGRYLLTNQNAQASDPGGGAKQLGVGDGYVLVASPSPADPPSGCALTPTRGRDEFWVLALAGVLIVVQRASRVSGRPSARRTRRHRSDRSER
jgi:hypothetical protein